MYNKNWIKDLDDKHYRAVSKSPNIIKCKNCEFNCRDNTCSNIYSYPRMPKDFGCKNGRLEGFEIFEYSLLNKLSDKFLLFILKRRLKNYRKSEKQYLKDKSIGNKNWYTTIGIPQLENEIAELQNKINHMRR